MREEWSTVSTGRSTSLSSISTILSSSNVDLDLGIFTTDHWMCSVIVYVVKGIGIEILDAHAIDSLHVTFRVIIERVSVVGAFRTHFSRKSLS